jgi:hypothetical protein
MKKLITNIAQLVNIREKNQLLRGSDQKRYRYWKTLIY